MAIILGISAYYHDSAAALLIDGKLFAAAQEERFTRVKHDASFPKHAIHFLLKEANISSDDLDMIIFYEKPFLKFERLLQTYHSFAPLGLSSFVKAIPLWIKEKIFIKYHIASEIKKFGHKKIPIYFSEHHLSHAASAYYPSPFTEAAILTVDGVGEYATMSIYKAEGHRLTRLREQNFPHSIGLLYSSFTFYCGFKVNSGEYKLMGLAPYANPQSIEVQGFLGKIRDHMVDVKDDGSIFLNMDYFNFATGLSMTNDKKWEELFGFCRRMPRDEISPQIISLACAAQILVEEIILKLALTAQQATTATNLCMAGGVALNCVANGKLLKSGIFKKIWIQPASGDAGGAVGAAFVGWHIIKNQIKSDSGGHDLMQGAFLGPEYKNDQILISLKKFGLKYKLYQQFSELSTYIAKEIAQGKIIGWFQGKMEFGPRALGNRSILGDPGLPDMQMVLNKKVKFREDFRPFAPCALEEDAEIYFGINIPSPYMLYTYSILDRYKYPMPLNFLSKSIDEKLEVIKSKFPAITHIDYSSRLQTVHEHLNPRLYQILKEFKKLKGYGILVNTSFNVKDEPIVCSPDDAIKCFLKANLDLLVLGDYVIVNENN